MVTQDFTLAKLIFAEVRIWNFFKTTTNLSYDQKCSPYKRFSQLEALVPCAKTKVCTPFTSYIHQLYNSGRRVLIQHSYMSYKQL